VKSSIEYLKIPMDSTEFPRRLQPLPLRQHPRPLTMTKAAPFHKKKRAAAGSSAPQTILNQRLILLAPVLGAVVLYLFCSNASLEHTPPPQHMSAAAPAAAEFVMGIVSAPAAGDVAQSLARLLVSSKVLSASEPHSTHIL
jgi:hypothetical protein